VSLEFAQLQGVSAFGAHLQGARLDGAQLQGARLDGAQLQGATLAGTGVQGASLFGAELQGATLDYAQLQGASLIGAHLQGARLGSAQLQGARLTLANLQGASLTSAEISATDFSGSLLWRTTGTIRLPLGPILLKLEDWKPVGQPEISQVGTGQPWDTKAYQALRDLLVNTIAEGAMRDDALKRIERLDCGNPDKTLASCDSAAAPPPEVLVWHKELARASVDDAAYAKAFATELRSLVCASDVNAIYILRGIMRVEGRLAETGREAPALVDFIMSKDCPVSASLTDDDKAKLLKIKQAAEQISGPPTALKKEQ
jgi:Pentapeptide repeats (8 copies)